jgi:MFS family permease
MAIFVADGAVFASWVSRLPQVHENLQGGTAVLGLALAGTAVGALGAMPLTGLICRTRSPYRVACVTLFLLCCSVVLPGLATSAWTLGLVLVVFGAFYGATDVSMNAAAVELAAAVRRPIVPLFHAGYSVGALAGAGVGSLAAAAGIGVPVHLAVIGAAGVIALVLTSGRLFVRHGRPIPAPVEVQAHDADPERPEPAASTSTRDGTRDGSRALATAALMTTSAAFVEGVSANWSGIYLVEVAGAALWTAPLAYALLMTTEAAVRSGGARLLTRFGTRRVAAVGAVLGGLGLLAALIPLVPISLLGYAVAGVGLGCLFPIGIAHAGAARGSVGVSVASTSGYAGFLVGPPIVGVLAEALSLPVALGLVATTQAAAFVGTRHLPARA